MKDLVVVKDCVGTTIVGELAKEEGEFMELEYPIAIGVTPDGKIAFVNYFSIPEPISKIKVKIAAKVLDLDEKVLTKLKSMHSEYKMQVSSFRAGLSLVKSKKDVEKVAQVIRNIQNPNKN